MQRGCAYGHRGWKRHPCGIWSRAGTLPGIETKRSVGARMFGIGSQQPLRVRMRRVGEQVVGRRPFHDPAGVHDGDVVADVGDDTEIVGDEQQGHAELVLQFVQQAEDRGLDGDVERGGRFVGDEDLRLAGQGDREHHPLAHAAAELVGIVVDPLGGPRDVHHVEQFDGAPAGVPARGALVAAHDLPIWSPTVNAGFRLRRASW